MKFASVFMVAIFAANASGGFSQQPNPNPCENPKTTVEMRECAAYRLKKSEKELDQVISTLMTKFADKTHKKIFNASQDAWRKYRDTEAEFEGYFHDGGTIQPQIKLDCMTRLTQDRIKELRKLLEDEFNH